MITNKNYYEEICEQLEAMDNNSLVELWNELATDYKYFDDLIYPMYQLYWELPANPVEAFEIGLSANKDFNTSDDYFYLDGYGNYHSTDDPFDIIDEELLVEYLERFPNKAARYNITIEEEDEDEE